MAEKLKQLKEMDVIERVNRPMPLVLSLVVVHGKKDPRLCGHAQSKWGHSARKAPYLRHRLNTGGHDRSHSVQSEISRADIIK